MKSIHIALATDARCVRGCAATMRSVLDCARPGSQIRFHLILSGAIPAGEIRALGETVTGGPEPNGQIVFHRFDTSSVRHLLRSRLITHTAYALLDLGELLPGSVERVVYLDCDLAFERDVTELWESDLEGRTLGAVDNGAWQDSGAHQRRLGLSAPRYFNSGVLLIDLARWRERSVGVRAREVAARMGDQLILHDQDALNAALDGDWIALADHWNVWTIHPDLRDDSRAVFHFMGAPKPWRADYNGRFREKFFAYLDRTAFAGWRPWNPGGVAALAWRVRRQVPYLPTALRMLRTRLHLSAGAR